MVNYIYIGDGESPDDLERTVPKFILPTSTISILRQGAALSTRRGIASPAILDRGIDAADDGSLVEFRLDCTDIEALYTLVDATIDLWEGGDLPEGAGTYEALVAATETLSEALDDAHEGELDGHAAARDHDRAFGDDTPAPDSWVRNDAGEVLGVH